MIKIYFDHAFHEINKINEELMPKALWIDLLNPTRKEEKLIEQCLNVDIPTQKERQEIEPSSRLYEEDNHLYMTATMLAKSKSPEPQTDAVTFILTQTQLITIRYIEPQAFKLFTSRLARSKKTYDAKTIFITLLETASDRLADILEEISHEFDQISFSIFRKNNEKETKKIDYHHVLKQIGMNGDLLTRTRESLVSFTRLIAFVDQTFEVETEKRLQLLLGIIHKDVKALNDYASFISNKTNFLLEATLGMVNIEQNNIIKIFSVAAVIFLPPTLIASIYGMNFTFMPELNTTWGYPFAIGLMILSAIFPYFYFKKRKWL